MRFKPFLGYMLFLMVRISLVCQKLDLNEIESENENLKCMGIMQDNLCHPYILSTTVLSDQLSVLILSEIKPFNDKHASEHLDLHRQQSVADVAF